MDALVIPAMQVRQHPASSGRWIELRSEGLVHFAYSAKQAQGGRAEVCRVVRDAEAAAGTTTDLLYGILLEHGSIRLGVKAL